MTTVGRSFAQFLALPYPLVDEDVLRELLSYDVRCRASFPLKKLPGGRIVADNLIDAGDGKSEYLLPSPLHWSRQVEWPWCIEQADLQSHHRCLDVGSGWSVLKYAVAKRSGDVVCLDNDPDSMQKATEATRRIGAANVSHVEGDARSLPLPDETFDRVFCVSVLEHLPGDDVSKALSELIRVLKPGGVLLLTFDVVMIGPVCLGHMEIDVDGLGSVLTALDITDVREVSRVYGSNLPQGTGKNGIYSVVLMKWIKQSGGHNDLGEC